MTFELNIENPNWKYKTFADDIFGIHYVFTFDNGYKASVIKTRYSYGSDKDLWELAVIKDDRLHYDNSVAQGDVRGYLTDKEVNNLLREIEQFKGE